MKNPNVKTPVREYVNVPLKKEIKVALSEQAVENGRSVGMEASFVIERAMNMKAARTRKVGVK